MTATRESAARFRIRLLTGCALLVGLAVVQDPGLLSSDTKFDLVADPAAFLERALHLWDPLGAFGQVQNQAYGYLWPMGPFFLLGWLGDLPGWLVQRLWVGLVMAVAFAGSAKLARALGVRSDLACLVAGVAFALSPRMLTTLGPISIEAWPSALAPWVLLPLVIGATRGSPRRAAALSGLAVAMVGGVNAAASFAVIPVAAVWLLTRTPGPRRRALMLWWPAFTLLGTLWWLVPLFVLGAYSPPFLSYIETTSVTTFPTTVFDALRGTSNWVPYADSGSRAGNDLITTAYLALNSAVVLLLGFVGLADRRTPHRAFLAISLLVGLLMVTAGHHGVVQGWFADPVRSLLDGSLSPLRNVHKFDPVIRLPLVLGLAFVLDRAMARPVGGEPRPALERVNRAVLAGLALVAVVAAAMPAVVGRIVPAGATLGVPAYWEQTAAWLDRESDGTTALVVPGAPFGEYIWGEPKDEPLQYLATSRWAVRNVIPLAPPGNIRMLDAVEARLAQGSGSEAFTQSLRRAGVRFLVVRNDLQRADDVPDPVLVHQTIEQSPGLARVAQFGPAVGGDPMIEGPDGRILINGGWQARYPAVEIFEVDGPVYPAFSSATPATVVGGPEDLGDLQEAGAISADPVVLATDAAEVPEGRLVLTDGLRARERYFARIHDGASAVLTPGDRPRSGNPVRDYLLDSGDRWSTTSRLEGAAEISASSSASDADALGGARRGELPYAAVDGSPETSWVSGRPAPGSRAWWMLRLDAPLDVDRVVVSTPSGQGRQAVTVETANGSSDVTRIGPGGRRLVRLPAGGPVTWIRVTDASSSGGRTLALAEVEVPRLEVERSLVVPPTPGGWGAPDAILLRADHDARTGCVRLDGEDRCRPSQARSGEEPHVMRRVVGVEEPVDLDASLTAWPRAGDALDALVLEGQPVSVTASSAAVPSPQASPVAMIDGDRGTSWIADVEDERPTVDLAWLGTRRIDGIRIAVGADVPARRPTQVQLTWPGGVRQVRLGADGRGSFRPIRTDRLTLTVTEAEEAVSLSFDDTTTALGVGIGELRLAGLPYLPLGLSADPVRSACGVGPTLAVDGLTRRTAVVASPLALARGTAVTAEPCGRSEPAPVRLRAGENRITMAASPAFGPGTVLLTASGGEPASTVGPALDSAPDPVTRRLTPGAGDTVVGLRENANPGWVADQDGDRLEALALDGWQQGWRVSGSEPVTARFAPDPAYRLGLLVGLTCLLALTATLGVARRRWPGADLPPLGERAVSVPVLAGAVLLGAGWIAGTVGVVVALATAVLAVLARRLPPEVSPWLFALPVLVAGGAYALRPWGSSSGWAGELGWIGYLGLVPVVAVLVGAAAERRPGNALFRRRAGRSIRR